MIKISPNTIFFSGGLDQCIGNFLIECQKCHDLFHQKCHRPYITEEELDDPFNIFFCSYCSNKVAKSSAPKKRFKPNDHLFD